MRSLPVAAFVACALVSGVVSADFKHAGQAEPEHIFGGQETEQCAWPTVAYLSAGSSACTGALIHPQIVLTAAHCVPGNAKATVRFGERASTAVQLADTEYCKANPGFYSTGDGTDYGFCKLAKPITNIPIIPVAFGCEETVLGVGTQVVHVGFGVDENGSSGRKKSVGVTVQNITGQGELITGTFNTGICSGDSGGPTFVRLPTSQGGDDTWRVVGIHSWAQMQTEGVCNGSAGSVIASNAIAFIEQESGIDVTPCHTPSGQWDPTWGCQGFPTDPGVGGGGQYQIQCDTGPLIEFSEVCGPPLSDFPDETPPTLVVHEPAGDVEFEVDPGGTGNVRVSAEADDGDGWGVAGVELVIAPVDGEMVTQTIDFPPYEWDTTFPVGAYNLKLIATDNAGNVTESEWIAIGVGTAPPENPPGGDDGADGGTSDDGAGGTDGGTSGGSGDDGSATSDGDAGQMPPGDEQPSASGCGCNSDTPRPMAALWLGLVAVVVRRRTRA